MLGNSIVLFGHNPAAEPISRGILDAEKVPRQRFRKEVAKVGDFEMAGGKRFKITPDMLKNFQVQFGRMKTNGVSVPVMSGHTFDPDKTRGRVYDVFVEGDSLYAGMEMIGKDAIEMARRNDVSILARKTYKDGKGVAYSWPILHVAMTPSPVIPGLKDAVEIAASATGGSDEKVPVARPANRRKESRMELKDVLKLVGLPEGVDLDNDDEIKASLEEHIGTLTTGAQEATGLRKKVKSLEAQVVSLKEKVKGDDAKEPSPTELRLSRRTRQQDLDNLVANGNITKAAADRIAADWIGEGDNETLKLSLDEASLDRWDGLIEALKENDGVALGEHALQTARTHERREPGNREADPEEDNKVVGTMLRLAGVKQRKAS